MISYVRGRVAAVTLSSAVLDVGGVGIELMCTPGTLASLRTGQEATLPSSMVVREDSMTLFGFVDEDEKGVFELAQTASGVGPKLAQAMLAVLSPDGIRTAIASEDAKTLTKVPGIGQKGAQRIILELKDRIGAPVGSAPAPVVAGGSPVEGPGPAGARRSRLVGPGGGQGHRDRRGGRHRLPAGRGRPAPGRAADPEQGVSPMDQPRDHQPMDQLSAAEEEHLESLTASGADADERTRSTAWPGPPRRCCTWRWRTSESTSSSARGRARPRSR